MNRKKIFFLIALCGLLPLAAYWIYERIKYVSTDDANVQAHTLMLSSRVTGTALEVPIEENQKVKAGQVLAVLDDRDYANNLKQVEADLATQQTRTADAATNFKRISGLFSSRAVSQQQFDDVQARYREAMKNMSSVQARVDQARLNLSYTRIVAPSDGIIAKKAIEVGMFVPVGQPIFGFVENRERWVVANFKETELKRLRIGGKATVTVDAVSGRSFEGEVLSMAPATGATFALIPPDNATGNFTKVVQRVPVRIRLLNLAESDVDLLQAGLSALVSVEAR